MTSPLPRLPANPLGAPPSAPQGSPLGQPPRPLQLRIGSFGRRPRGPHGSPLPVIGRRGTPREVAEGRAAPPSPSIPQRPPAQIIQLRPEPQAPTPPPTPPPPSPAAQEREHLHGVAHERVRGFVEHLPAAHQHDARIHASDALNRWARAYQQGGLAAARALRDRRRGPQGNVGPKLRKAGTQARAEDELKGGMERRMEAMPQPIEETNDNPQDVRRKRREFQEQRLARMSPEERARAEAEQEASARRVEAVQRELEERHRRLEERLRPGEQEK